MTSRQKIKKNKKSDNSYRASIKFRILLLQLAMLFTKEIIGNRVYLAEIKSVEWSQRGRIAYDNSLGQCRARHNVCGAKSRRELLGGIAWKYAHLSNTFDTVHGVT